MQCEQRIEWRGLCLWVPVDWQVVRHSRSERKGSLTLMDRRRQRLQVIWTRCASQPDLGHMIHDHRSRQLELDGEARFEPLTDVVGWRGLHRLMNDGEVLTRAARFDEPTCELVEMMILTRRDDPAEADLAATLLENLEVTCPAQEATRWCAFGVDLVTPEDWRLSATDVKPADVRFDFEQAGPREDKPGPGVAMVRRMGMAASWYKDAQTFLRKRAKKVRFEFEPAQACGHAATRAIGREPGTRLQRWARRLRRREDLIWHCPVEDAVYHVSTLSKPAAPIEPDAFILCCCRE